MPRDEFPEHVKTFVAMEVLLLCSHPGCRRPTFGPTSDPSRLMNVGTAAHITAASENGPRWNASMSSEERRSPANAIWLCRDHGKAIDDDPIAFPAPLLHQWKEDAIRYAQRAVMLREVDVDGRSKVIFAAQHDLAKRLSLTIAAMTEARRTVIESLRRWRSKSFGSEHARSRLSGRELGELRPVVKSVKALEAEVSMMWGPEICDVVTTLRKQTHFLERYVTARMDTDVAAHVGTAVLIGEPRYEGAAFDSWMTRLTALANDWLRPFVRATNDLHLTLIEVGRMALQIETEARDQAVQEWEAIQEQEADQG